jgi:hypothetical protein
MKTNWSKVQDQQLLQLKNIGKSWSEIAEIMGRSYSSCNMRWTHIHVPHAILTESPQQKYDKPLVTVGNATVLPDTEFPYHNAEFINKVLELSAKWKITNCVLAGDAVHFDSLTGWDPSWKEEDKSGLDTDKRNELMDFMDTLPDEFKQEGIELIETIDEPAADNISDEIKISRAMLRRIGESFQDVVFVIGNHEGRLLRTMNSPLFAKDLLQFIGIDDPVFRIAPYYYSLIETCKGTFRVVHPKGAAKSTATQLASKTQQHILMAHSHRWAHQYDISGTYHAIQMGCCVDESRLAYVGQRDNTSDKHKLGAVIIRDGFPYLLGEETPWDQYMKMA